jgi:hypothetical protein
MAIRFLFAASLLAVAVLGFSPSLLAQSTPPGGSSQSDQTRADRRNRGNFSPQAMLDAMRDRLEVTDDAEWALISQRIQTVFELRRSAGGFGGFRVRSSDSGGGDRRATRSSGSPEYDALRDAVTDKMPDAEIKARLERLRVVRKQDQVKLEKAQDDLRAVLTVRQEAVLVMMGILS